MDGHLGLYAWVRDLVDDMIDVNKYGRRGGGFGKLGEFLAEEVVTRQFIKDTLERIDESRARIFNTRGHAYVGDHAGFSGFR
jgi:hypothetical protein